MAEYDKEKNKLMVRF